MADGTLDFRLRLIDDLSKEMKKTRKMTESALESMSKEQKKLNKEIYNQEVAVVKLQHKLHNASKEEQKDIRETIRLTKASISQKKKQERIARRDHQIRTKTTFGERIGRSAGEGINKGINKGIGRFVTGAVIGGAAIGGLRELYQVSKENEQINQKLRTAFSLTGDALNDMNIKVKTLSSAFGEDYSQIIISANALSKEMGITGEEAMNLVQKGFEKGANSSEEFLDILKEYPALLSQMGIGAEESIAIITQQVKSGVYSDKGIDAMKEANELLTDNSDNTKKALKLLPKKTQEEIKSNVALGKTFNAMKLVSGELKNLSNKDRFTVTQAVFGTPGLDAGQKTIDALATINTNLDEVDDTMSDFQKSTIEMDTAWNTFTTSITESDGSISKVFKSIIGGITDMLDQLTELNEFGIDVSSESRSKVRTFTKQLRGEIKGKSPEEQKKILQKRAEELFTEAQKSSESINRFDRGLEKIGIDTEDVARTKLLKLQTIAVEKMINSISDKVDVKNVVVNKNKNKIDDDLKNISNNRNVKSLTINIDSLIKDGVTIETTNISESPAQIEKLFVKTLMNVVNQSSNQFLNNK